MPEENPSTAASAATNEPGAQAAGEAATEGVETLPAWAQKLLTDTRQEAASYRVKYQEIKPLAEKAQELEEAGKTELQRALDELGTVKTQLTPVQQENARLKVAMQKGLTLEQAERLKGATVEELTADADALLVLFGNTNTTEQTPPFGRPKENLRGGSNPAQVPEDMNPTTLAAKVRRSAF